MKIQNALVSNIFDRSQQYFAHVTTVTLSWRVQNIVVIGRVYFTLECFEFSSNFEFDRNMLSGTGACINPSVHNNSKIHWYSALQCHGLYAISTERYILSVVIIGAVIKLKRLGRWKRWLCEMSNNSSSGILLWWRSKCSILLCCNFSTDNFGNVESRRDPVSPIMLYEKSKYPIVSDM